MPAFDLARNRTGGPKENLRRQRALCGRRWSWFSRALYFWLRPALENWGLLISIRWSSPTCNDRLFMEKMRSANPKASQREPESIG